MEFTDILKEAGLTPGLIKTIESLAAKEALDEDDKTKLQTEVEHYAELKISPKFRDQIKEEAKKAQDKTFAAVTESLKTQARRIADFDAEELKQDLKPKELMDMLADKLRKQVKENDPDLQATRDRITELQTKNQDLLTKYEDFQSNFERYKSELSNEYATREKNRKVDQLLLRKVNDRTVFLPVDNLPSETLTFQQEGILSWIKQNAEIDPDTGSLTAKDGTKLQSPDGNYIWENLDQAISGYADYRKLTKRSHTAQLGDGPGIAKKTVVTSDSKGKKTSTEVDLTGFQDILQQAKAKFGA